MKDTLRSSDLETVSSSFASDGNASWIFSTDAERTEVRAWALDEGKAVLFASKRIRLACDIQLALVLRVCAHGEISEL